jgi:hypothetical protein
VLQNKIDPFYVDDLRNFLFGKRPSEDRPGVANGTDLSSRNIQRGRDHGIPRYNDIREYFGLRRIYNFSEITQDEELQKALESVYKDPDFMDPYIGGLAEGMLVGLKFTPIPSPCSLFSVLCSLFSVLRSQLVRRPETTEPTGRAFYSFSERTIFEDKRW